LTADSVEAQYHPATRAMGASFTPCRPGRKLTAPVRARDSRGTRGVLRAAPRRPRRFPGRGARRSIRKSGNNKGRWVDRERTSGCRESACRYLVPARYQPSCRTHLLFNIPTVSVPVGPIRSREVSRGLNRSCGLLKPQRIPQKLASRSPGRIVACRSDVRDCSGAADCGRGRSAASGQNASASAGGPTDGARPPRRDYAVASAKSGDKS